MAPLSCGLNRIHRLKITTGTGGLIEFSGIAHAAGDGQQQY